MLGLMCFECIFKIVYCSALTLLHWNEDLASQQSNGLPIPPALFLETCNLWFHTLPECAGAIILFKIIARQQPR